MCKHKSELNLFFSLVRNESKKYKKFIFYNFKVRLKEEKNLSFFRHHRPIRILNLTFYFFLFFKKN